MLVSMKTIPKKETVMVYYKILTKEKCRKHQVFLEIFLQNQNQ